MIRKQVILELSVARTAIWLQKGRSITLLESVEQPAGDWNEQWGAAAQAQIPLISQWVAKRGLKGAHACVVYSRPGTPVIFNAVPRTVPGDAATRLALIEASPFPMTEGQASVFRLGSDGHSSATPQNHYVAFAEQNAVLQAIEEVVTASGLHADGSLPAAAAALHAAYLAVDPGAAAPSVALHIGLQHAAIVAAEGGRIRFARLLTAGLEQLATTYKREMIARGATGLAALGPVAAFTSVGVPKRGGTAFGIPTEPILPPMQSVFQRIVVELKQSIRFGFAEQLRGGISATICGEGANVPDLAELITQQAGCSVAPVVPGARTGPVHPALISAAVLSLPAANRSRLGELRHAIVVGTFLAAAAVLADGLTSGLRVAGLRREVAALLQAADTAASSNAVADRARESEQTLASIRSRISSWANPSTRPDVLMREISLAMGDSAVISEIDIRNDKSGSIARIRGIAASADNKTVQQIVDRLAASPLITDARIESLRRGGKDLSGREGGQFDMVLRLAPIPLAGPATAAVPAEVSR